MKTVSRFALIFCLFAISASGVLAGEFEPGADGPWVNVDVIDLVEYGDASYLDYLGEGYVAILEKVKQEGLILDFGVMMRVTGNNSDGDVVIWWSFNSLADYEKVGDRMGEILSEMKSAQEWQDIWQELEKLRTVRSSNFYRQVLWTEAAE